jgi:hypothetical protein
MLSRRGRARAEVLRVRLNHRVDARPPAQARSDPWGLGVTAWLKDTNQACPEATAPVLSELVRRATARPPDPLTHTAGFAGPATARSTTWPRQVAHFAASSPSPPRNFRRPGPGLGWQGWRTSDVRRPARRWPPRRRPGVRRHRPFALVDAGGLVAKHRQNPGDCLVITGIDHAWRAGPSGCRVRAVVLGTPPIA